jgi:hypothetical protein
MMVLKERRDRERALQASSQPPPAEPSPPAQAAQPAPVARASDDDLVAVHHSAQWVFGTAAAPLVDARTGEAAAAASARVLLVYPMEQDSDTGRVTMRLKRADPVTAALEYVPVVVYDPELTPSRRVVDYSLVA